MDLRQLGRRIRALREERGLKQRDLASALRVSAQAVSKWERGENAPDISLLVPLSRLLDVSTDVLLGREPEETFPATVFASGLAGFAHWSSTTPPREVALTVNALLHLLTEAVLAGGGVPVKGVGDGLLAFFTGSDHAGRAAAAALQAHRLAERSQMSIALHCGEVFLGKVGHAGYANLDIIGDTVNTAFLILAWAEEQGQSVAASGAVAEHLDPERVVVPRAKAVPLTSAGRLVDIHAPLREAE